MFQRCPESLVAASSVEYLTRKITKGTSADVAVLTNNWISAQGGPEKQLLKGLAVLFQTAVEHSEVMNEIIMEAWAVFLDRQIWKARYPSLQEALRVMAILKTSVRAPLTTGSERGCTLSRSRPIGQEYRTAIH